MFEKKNFLYKSELIKIYPHPSYAGKNVLQIKERIYSLPNGSLENLATAKEKKEFKIILNSVDSAISFYLKENKIPIKKVQTALKKASSKLQKILKEFENEVAKK